VAERLLHGPEVDARFPQQRRVRVDQIVEPHRPGDGLHLVDARAVRGWLRMS
jgi:hypothetical protein